MYKIMTQLKKNGEIPQTSFFAWLSRSNFFAIFALCFTMLFSTKAFAQTTELSVDLKNVSIGEVLNRIESTSPYRFLYNQALVDVSTKTSVTAKNQPVDKVLDQTFKGTDIDYNISGKQIVLKKAEPKPVSVTTKKANVPVSDLKTITGTVTDDKGEVVVGAAVLQKGTTNGTITDVDGRYTISNISENAVLLFSYIGMNPKEVYVGANTTIDVSLTYNVANLSEVVVIGYGVQKKKLITGATVNIKGEDLGRLNTVSSLTAMQGQSPGVSITQNSGKPGSDFKINIRGLGTIGNASPLVIIDNIVGGDLNQLNPNDIESVDILKDAASSAIYGARAANGVVLVRTKQGKKGKPSISFDTYYGVQNVAKYVDVLNAQQYIDMQNESYKNTGAPIPNWAALVPEYGKVQQGWQGTNWQKEFTNKNAPIQNHSLSLTGGSEYSTFSMGLSYTSQEGTFGEPAPTMYNRYSLRLNSEHVILKNKSFDILKIGENILYNHIDQPSNAFATGNGSFNDVRNMVNRHPLMSVLDSTGQYSKVIPWAETANPIGTYIYQRSNSEQKTHSIRVNPYVELQPVKGLVFRSNFGYTYDGFSSRSYVPIYNLGGRTLESVDRINQSQSSGYGYQISNTLNYKTSINKAHNVDVLVGQSVEKSGLGTSISGGNRGSIFSDFEYAYLSNVKALSLANMTINGSPWGERTLKSYFGRVNYDFKETYLLSLILRSDGSSNFAPDKRWGYFPSVAAGWVLTNESFMKSLADKDVYLKLRASWGQNGNQAISPFQYLSTYRFSGGDYYFGPEKNAADVGAYPSILPNKDVTWETSEQLNIGFDARFFKSRLGVNFDWYNKTTKDWLVQAPVPATWGAAAPFINGGDISNKGVELGLSWRDRIGDFTYSVNGNVAFNKNEITRIANAEGIIEGGNTIFSTSDRSSFYRAQVGYPIGYFYGYKTAGVFQNKSEIDGYKAAKLKDTKPGDLIYLDINQDGVIDSKDKTNIGDPNPNAIFGLSISLGYKNFDFSVSANGVAGNQIASNLRPAESLWGNWPTQYLGRWHGEGTSNRYPRADAAATANWGLNSDIYIEDGDYLRIQNMTLGYNFSSLFPKSVFSQARVFVAANNLFTFTKYFGSDPEIGFATEGWSKGIDLGFYPSPRTIMVGASLKF
jgi:TonB-dependent starch-binding outer membrane protein SusC